MKYYTGVYLYNKIILKVNIIKTRIYQLNSKI